MTPIRALFLAGCLGSGGLAYLPEGNSSDLYGSYSTDPTNSSALVPFDYWGEHMKKAGYLPNADVCKMIKHNDTNAWDNSKASDFVRSFIGDHVNNTGDWVQMMHLNATNGSKITPGDLDCTMLHSENCQPPHDGDCENYNPAAFQLVQAEIVNLYSVLQSMDIAAIKETLLDSLKLGELVRDFIPESNLAADKQKLSVMAGVMWIVGGIFAVSSLAGPAGLMGTTLLVEKLMLMETVSTVGSFSLNTAGAALGLASATKQDGAIDMNKLEDELSAHLGDFFDSISDTTAAFAAKVFGGTPHQNVDLVDWVSRINPNQSAPEGETAALASLFQNGWFLNQTDTKDTIQPMFESGFALMKVGLIGYIFQARGFYVMHFTEQDQDTCIHNYDGASRYVDGGCFILKVGGRCINDDDNAWGEINRAEDKYGLLSENFFRNVRDCNNNQDQKVYSMDTMGDMAQCFFPLPYLHNPKPSEIWNINQTIADQVGVRHRKSENDILSGCPKIW